MTGAVPPVASLWVGTELRWLDRLSLRSFVHRGNAVTLFHTHDLADPQIDGVALRPASDVFAYSPELLEAVTPTVFADMFRLHMVRDTDNIWVDSDCLCLRPFTPRDGYLLGFETPVTVNNAVVRLPADSPALTLLLDRLNDPAFIPPWLKSRDKRKLRNLPQGEQLIEASRLIPNVYGPPAMTWALTQTGEIDRAMPTHVLNPVHWSLADIYFNPYGGVDGWLRPDTMGLHLYSSRVRAAHRRAVPFKGSFIANFAAEVGFDFDGAPLRDI